MRVILGASLLAVAAAFVGQSSTRHHSGVRRARAPPNEALPGGARPLVPAQRAVGGARLSATTAATTEAEEAEAVAEMPEDVGSRMRAVFEMIDADGSGHICEDELGMLIRKGLNMATATDEEVAALFNALDTDGNGEIDYEEWWSWYSGIVDAMDEKKKIVYDALYNRRTTNDFDTTPVDDSVVLECVRAARYAPNHKLTEPWRFIQLGTETINKVAAMNAATIEDPEKQKKKLKRWADVPGWMVVTSQISEGDELMTQEDYAATCCAIQNFQLAMYAEGLGTKWTTGDITRSDEFYDLIGVDKKTDRVAGVIWYGFANKEAKYPFRKLHVEDVLSKLP